MDKNSQDVIEKEENQGASPVAEWLSSHARLWWPRVLRLGSWAQAWHRSSGHVEAASHIPQLERRATKIYNCVQGGLGG